MPAHVRPLHRRSSTDTGYLLWTASRAAPRIWVLGVVATIGVLALSYAVICVYTAGILTKPDQRSLVDSPDRYGLTYESVSFLSRVDGLRLDGWLLEPPRDSVPRRAIIVVHGKASDRTREAHSHILAIAAQLVRHGYPTLLFDLRGSGLSEGERFTLGVEEVRDVGSAIDFLDQRGLAAGGVDLLGYSMGGATALLASPSEPLVHAVAEDSGYSDLRDLIETEIPTASGLPGFFTPGMIFAARAFVGADLYSVRPIDGVPSLASRGIPLLVIHGQADGYVPVVNGYRIAAAYGPTVQTMFVPGADHVRSYEADPTAYIARLTAFFDGGT